MKLIICRNILQLPRCAAVVALLLSLRATPLFSATATGADKVVQAPTLSITSGLQPIGEMPRTNELSVALILPLQNRKDLASLVAELYTPGSPNFGKFLTPDEFGTAFGASKEDYEAVARFAENKGLHVMQTFPSRFIIVLSGSVDHMEAAFKVKLLKYREAADGRPFYAPDSSPTVPANLQIIEIDGLDNYSQAHIRSGSDLGGRSQMSVNSGSGRNGYYKACDLRAAYAPGVTQTGARQTVGVFSLADFETNSVLAYEDANGLTRVPIETVLLDNYDGTPDSLYNWETTPDIELVLAMAPGLSKVIVFEGNPFNPIASHILAAMANYSPRINQFSSSFSWPGGPSEGTDAIFLQMITQGQSFFESSGNGDADWQGRHVQQNYFPPLSVDDPRLMTTPQDNPFITLVGGTSLSTTGPGGEWASEAVWNVLCNGNGEGSSGGHSDHYPLPSWQQGIDMEAVGGSSVFRNVPDISIVADGIYQIEGGDDSQKFMGTSAGAPLWAGFCALANQRAADAGNPPVGFLNPLLYRVGRSFSHGQVLRDITAGNNFTNCLFTTRYTAAPGYDLCTGWGSPAGADTINMLSPVSVAPPSGLVAWWKGEWNCNDVVGGNNGAGEGMLTFVVGEVGSGFSFPPNGCWYGGCPWVHVINGGQLNVGQGPGFTVECWISPSDQGSRPIIEWNTGRDMGSIIGVHLWSGVSAQGTLYANIVDVNGVNHTMETQPGILVPNLLHHVALTYDKTSGIALIYLDGLRVLQSNIGSITPQTSYDLWLGSRGGNAGSTWAGIMDEVSLYNRALTVPEVWSIFAAANKGKQCVACDCLAPPPGLVSWWRAESSTQDSAGVNGGTPEGGLWYSGGEVGSGFVMNGADADVRVPSSPSLNVGAGGSFSIEGWVKPLDYGMRPIVEWQSSTAIGAHFWVNVMGSGSLFANIKGTDGADHYFSTPANMLPVAIWHHVALTYDHGSGIAVLYIDGAPAAQSNLGVFTPQTSFNMYIGARLVGGPTYRWNGTLDEISIYNRVLNPTEISSIFHAIPGKCHQ